MRDLHRFRWWALGCLVLSLLMIGFDMTILNVALPTFSQRLNANTSQLQWIMDAYLLVFSALLIPAGSLGDRYGRKRVLMVGFCIFGITSLLAGASKTTGMLITVRALMGIGGAIIMPLTFSILPTVFTPNERGKASAIWAAGSSFGLLIGPLLGGVLLKYCSWGSVFFINVPIVVLVLIGTYLFIPESKNPNSHRTDWIGMVVSCIGLSFLVYGIIEAPVSGWFSFPTISSVVIGLISFAIFIVWQRVAPEPAIDLSIFRNRSFTWATIGLCYLFFVLNGFLFFITQYLQFVLGNTAYQTGIKLIPFMAGMVIGSVLCNRMALRFGTKGIIVMGLSIIATGLCIFSFISPENGYGFVLICLVIPGLGVGLALGPSMSAVMSALPITHVGVGAAVNNTLRQVSGTLGVALLGSVVSLVYQNHVGSVLGPHSGLPIEQVQKSIGAGSTIVSKLREPLRTMLHNAVNTSFICGMSLALLMSALLIFLGVVLTVVYLPARGNDTGDESPSASLVK